MWLTQCISYQPNLLCVPFHGRSAASDKPYGNHTYCNLGLMIIILGVFGRVGYAANFRPWLGSFHFLVKSQPYLYVSFTEAPVVERVRCSDGGCNLDLRDSFQLIC